MLNPLRKFKEINHSVPETSDMLESFIRQCPIPVIEIDSAMTIRHGNVAFLQIAGLDSYPLDTTFNTLLKSSEHENFARTVQQACETQQSSADLLYTLVRQDGAEINILLSLTVLTGDTDKDASVLLLIHDVTEQKNLEMRFAHSQKMQAVGQLAGGVAHDFNNLLTAMIGFCDLLLAKHPAGDPSFADIMQVKQNANRAANLVRQLLAFSRRQTLQPKKLDVIDLLSELSNLMRRLIGENITLNVQHQRDIWPVCVDHGQLEQVLINLAVNARDAMKDGGILSVETSNVTIRDNASLDAELRVPPQEDMIMAGDYVRIVISDTGTGIPEAVLDNIFEPFFSTKPVGSGTGLGLSTVYGIIKQTGGYIYLASQEGKGTAFHLFIPRLVADNAAQEEAVKELPDMQDLTGTATVLLVEDETPVRIFASRALQNKGYHVLEAECAETALDIYEEHQAEVNVIVTDVMMPGMNGTDMVETLDKTYPYRMQHVKVMFMSGYAEDAFADGYDGNREFHFLSKPFTLKQLATRLKDLTKSTQAMN